MTSQDVKPQALTIQERQLRAEWLAKLGVPAPFRDAIIDAPTDWLTAWGGAVLGVAIVAVAIGATVAGFMWLDAHVTARAVAEAVQTGASLVYVNVGMGPFILLFGIAALGGWAFNVFATRYRVKGFLSAAAASLRPPPPGKGFQQALGQWLTRRMLSGPVQRAAAASATVDDFLRGMTVRAARPWGIAAAVLIPLAIALTVLETNSFWVAGPAAIVEHSMFAPFASEHHDIRDVTTLTTGCNHTDKDESLIYDVALPSGEEFGLGAGSVKAVAGSKAAAIEAIDAQIRQTAKVEHRRWQWLDRDPLHPSCLAYWARQFGRDGQGRLAQLLRVTAR